MQVAVRAARPDDAAAGLLYESAAPYYDVFAGSEARARRLLAGVFPRPAHAASFEVSLVAELDGALAGVLAGFPASQGEALDRRFLRLSVPFVPLWHWAAVARHLRAAARISPQAPPGAFYVDALAVAPHARRRGVATALLEAADGAARHAGARALARDTGLQNVGAQALYERFGFTRRDERRAPDERTARALGGPGFVAYVKAV